MSRVMSGVLVLVLCSLVIAVPSIWAYWVPDGVAICTAAETQLYPTIASDGAGGAIIAWRDYRSGNTDIYAQRLNALGIVQWTADGVAICTATGEQDNVTIISDATGGAIFTWDDTRNGGYDNYDIYVQRVNSSGAVQWTADGVALCTATGNQDYPAIVSDDMGGALVAWEDYRSGNDDIYARRVNSSGAVQWTNNGVALCTATGTQSHPTIVSDGAGGAIVVWEDLRSGSNYDIYARRVNISGSPMWMGNGVAISAATGSQRGPEIVSDGTGGAIVTWYDQRSGNYDIYAQRVNSSGAVQWAADGVALCTAAGSQIYPTIVSDGLGGAIITWYDSRGGNSDIYAQRVDASGAVQWAADGVALCTATGDQVYPTIASDGAGGAIVTWYDRRSGNDDIYAQRVDASGAVQWAADGVAVCTATMEQAYPKIISNGFDGAIITWHDQRSANSDVYAQSIDDSGHPGFLAPEIHSARDVPGDQGGSIYLSWDAALPDLIMDSCMSHYSIWRAISSMQAAAALDEGAAVLESLSELDAALGKPVVRIEQAGALAYYWELVQTVDALYMENYGKPVTTLFDSTAVCDEYHYFQVVAHTTDPRVFWKSPPDSGYSVDNLAPSPPLSLAGEQSFMPAGLNLTWKASGEADLDGYRVYRGLTEDFVPSEGNCLGALCDTLFFDENWHWSGGYYYKVSAVDVHGNESGYALLRPDDVTGSETPKAPEASYLAQNYPNPFNPMTRVEYGLVVPARASLRIYDAAGRLVCVLVDTDRAAGRYTELWDGCDGSGRPVASGMYFYRLEAGSFTDTKKMVLTR